MWKIEYSERASVTEGRTDEERSGSGNPFLVKFIYWRKERRIENEIVCQCGTLKRLTSIIIVNCLNNVSMEESNDPVDGHKDERQQGVVHKGKP